MSGKTDEEYALEFITHLIGEVPFDEPCRTCLGFVASIRKAEHRFINKEGELYINVNSINRILDAILEENYGA